MPIIPVHVSALLIALVFGVAFLVLIAVYVACKRAGLKLELRRNYFFLALFSMLSWLIFTLVLSISGFLMDFSANYISISILLIPPFALIAWLMFSKRFNQLIYPIDNFWFIYLQSYRLLREFLLLLLFRYNVIPIKMTFEGQNFDILIGITAPFMAYYCFKKKKWFRQLALIWNVAGIGLIANAILTFLEMSPNGAGNSPSGNFIFSFPFVWMPAFTIPLGVLLHLISLKKLLQKS